MNSNLIYPPQNKHASEAVSRASHVAINSSWGKATPEKSRLQTNLAFKEMCTRVEMDDSNLLFVLIESWLGIFFTAVFILEYPIQDFSELITSL